MGGRPREAPPGRRAAFLRGRSGKPPGLPVCKGSKGVCLCPGTRGALCVGAASRTWESRAFCLLPRPAPRGNRTNELRRNGYA